MCIGDIIRTIPATIGTSDHASLTTLDLVSQDAGYHALVVAMADKNQIAREALHRSLAELRRELLGPNPTPLERLTAPTPTQ